MILCLAFVLTTQSVYADPTPSAQAAADPLPVLAHYQFSWGNDNTKIAWSPDNTRIAFTNTQLSEESYEDWVVIAGILPSDTIIPVQKTEGYATAYWLDATRLAILDGKTYTVWSIPPDAPPTAEPQPATKPTSEEIAQAANKQCTRRVDGISVMGKDVPPTQTLRWSDPYEEGTISLGEMSGAENLQHPCLSGDGKQVAFTTTNNLVLASLVERSVPALKPAPAVWGAWTERQILSAMYPTGLPNLAHMTLQAVPWPGRPEAAAALVHGFDDWKLESTLAVIEASTGTLRVAAQTPIQITTGDTFSVVLEPSPISLHKTEHLLFIRHTYDAATIPGGYSGENHLYMRWNGTALDAILSFFPKNSNYGCSSEDSETSTVQVLQKANQGFFDVLITTEFETTAFGAENNATTKTKKTWRWNGSKYESVGKK